MHLKVPPPAIFLVAVLLLAAGHRVLPSLSITLPGQVSAALLLGLAGIVPGLQAVIEFIARKTTIDPRAPEKASTLVTGGIYRFSRNPMYLGLLCLLLAFALFWGTLTVIVVAPLFVWYMTEFQIKPEEDRLRQVFGADYEAYLAEVRRWI